MMPETTEGREPEVEEPISFSKEDMTKVRNEAKNYRLKLRESERMVEDLTTENKSFKDADKSELEKAIEGKANLERVLSERDRQIAERDVRLNIERAASYVGIEDTDAAYKLVDMSEIDLNNPKTIATAIQNLLKDKPYLRKAAPPTPGVGGPPLKAKKSADQQFAEVLRGAPKNTR